MLSCQFAHECTLAHRGKSNEADTGHTSPSNIESDTTTATATRGLKKLPLQFSELRL